LNSVSPSLKKKIPVKLLVIEDESLMEETRNQNIHEAGMESETSLKTGGQEQPKTITSLTLPYLPLLNQGRFYFRSTTRRKSVSDGERKYKYIFTITRSRKKEKKSVHKKINKIISRVHNMDCLLKKIKAKYLKYLFLILKKELISTNVDLRKFDQCVEVRNLNVPHNRDNFINLSVYQVLLNNKIINMDELTAMMNTNNEKLKILLNMKIKYHFQFEFMKSKYFKNWVNDPIKIYLKETFDSGRKYNKNCMKFPNHSKNIFQSSKENYEIYKKLLLLTSNNFIFYFQNNPLKFGKKMK